MTNVTRLRTHYAGDPLLPVEDLQTWLAGRRESIAEIERRSGVNARRLYCYRNGLKYHHLTIGVADRIVTALGAHIDDVWGDVDSLVSTPLEAAA